MAQVMVDRGTPRFDEAGVATFDDPPGLSIIETWDALGMRASGSHDLVLEAVRLPAGSVISAKPFGARGPAVAPSTEVAPPPPSTSGAGWALLVPSVYLGVARAARDAAVAFARDRRPEPMGGASIGSLPSVQRTLGEIEVHLAQAEATLFGAAEAWDAASSADRATFAPVLAVAKHVASNQSVAVADLAMRVVGGAGLARSHPVQRHYRDVRAPHRGVGRRCRTRRAFVSPGHAGSPSRRPQAFQTSATPMRRAAPQAGRSMLHSHTSTPSRSRGQRQ
ncbi:MAG: hypothetical protein EBS89_02165 [Proteobacteria bacterium]|nr:hypothetical protein [Pseudomonadota bacterium]